MIKAVGQGKFYPDEYKVWLGYMNNFFCQFAYPSSFRNES